MVTLSLPATARCLCCSDNPLTDLKRAADRKPSVAIDLDGTLAENYEKFDANKIGDPRTGAADVLREFQRRGYRIIIWTVRNNPSLIESWCDQHGIPFDHINENPDQPPNSSRKVYADVYVDDRAIDGRKGWDELESLVTGQIEKTANAYRWWRVSELVRERVKIARSIRDRIKSMLSKLPPTSDPGYGDVWWHPEEQQAWVRLADGDTEQLAHRYTTAIQSIPGVQSVRCESEVCPPDRKSWIRIKRGNWLNAPYEWAGALTGGPSPLSNALVNAALVGGAGYLGGTLAENMLGVEPEERGRLRRILGLAGLGVGAIPSLLTAYQNHNISAAAGKPLGFSSLITPDASVPVPKYESSLPASRERAYGPGGSGQPTEPDKIKSPYGDFKAAELLLDDTLAHYGLELDGLVKEAFASGASTLEPVRVDAFNRAIWNDVWQGGTSPPVGAAASGVVTSVQQMYGNSDLLSPRAFVNGLVAAGADYGTARLAGGVLGALGVMPPRTQTKLQEMGLWSGLMRGVTGTLLGMY
jgi:hypothetical protein